MALLAIVLLGSYFRLARLNECSLQMDNQDFLTPCREGLSFVGVFSHWQELPTGKNHLPFPVAFTAGVLHVFHLPVTLGNLILPSAIWGILMIPVAFAVGRELRGGWFGLLLAAMVALSPIYIQISRLAYYYIPALLGSFLSLWALLLLFRLRPGTMPQGTRLRVYATARQAPATTQQDAGTLPRYFYVVAAFSLFFLAYSDSSAWPQAALVASVSFGFLGYEYLRRKRYGRELLTLLAVYVCVGLPVLVSSWGLFNVWRNTIDLSPEMGAYWKQVFWGVGSPLPWVWPVIKSYAWGTTPWRSAFSILALTMGVAYGCFRIHRDIRYGVLIGLAVAGLSLALAALMQTIVGFSHARLAAATPAFIVVLAVGIASPADFIKTRLCGVPLGKAVSGILIVCAVVLALWPAWLCTRQTGRPSPYKAVVAWLDANLPADTPVLTERFFDAFNEFRVHPATNVIFMSTVRNQTASEYLGNRFRERSETFLQNSPVSALSQSRLLWDHPQVGAWTWPNEFFARRVVITNAAGLTLHRLGLNDQSIPGKPDHELAYLRTFLYNLPEDVVDKARRTGKPAVAFFGPGWKYTKTQDYRDWRVLGESATVEAYNLTTNALSVALVVRGVAVNGDKHVVLSVGGKQRFENMKLGDTAIAPLTLPPGHTRIEVKDPYWATRQVPLLVESVECRRVE